MEPCHDAWIGHSEKVTIVEIRNKAKISREQALNFYSVTTSDKSSLFIYRIEQMAKEVKEENAKSEVEGGDFYAKALYDAKIAPLIHHPTDKQR